VVGLLVASGLARSCGCDLTPITRLSGHTAVPQDLTEREKALTIVGKLVGDEAVMWGRMAEPQTAVDMLDLKVLVIVRGCSGRLCLTVTVIANA